MLRLVLLEDGPVMQVYDLEHDGRREAMDFIESQAAPAQSQLVKAFRLLAQTGRAGREEQMFKHLEGPVYEIKAHSANVRLYCFRHRHTVVVCTHGSTKPAGKETEGYRNAVRKVERLLEECRTAGVLP
jgi:plasmid stabilization system protein ParE